MHRRLLMAAGGAGSFTVPTIHYMLYNGSNGAGTYDIGFASSINSGTTWTKYASNPVISHGGAWYGSLMVDPGLFWDPVGSRWIVYVAGKGTNFAIGRWINSNLDLIANPTAWNADLGNPLITGSAPYTQVNFPSPYYDAGAVVTRLWYSGWVGSTTTIGYAEVAGTTGAITDSGKVIDVGAGGSYDDAGLATGPIIKVGSDYYVYYAGYDGAQYHTGYATCTTPATSATYTKQGVLAAFSGNIVLSGKTWQSNQLRGITGSAGAYVGYLSLFHPTDASGQEIAAQSTSTDGVTWTAPTALIPLGGGGTWDSNSAENPSVVVHP